MGRSLISKRSVNLITPEEKPKSVTELWLKLQKILNYGKLDYLGGYQQAIDEFDKVNKPTLPYIHRLTHTARVNGGFYFTITNEQFDEYQTPFKVWSAGAEGVTKKAERRSAKNVLSWWNFIFSEYLHELLHVELRKKTKRLHFYMYRFNNITLRYFFMHHLYMKNLKGVPSLYFLRYNFLIRNYTHKKQRHIKKYKRKGTAHSDRFSRREFWLSH